MVFTISSIPRDINFLILVGEFDKSVKPLRLHSFVIPRLEVHGRVCAESICGVSVFFVLVCAEFLVFTRRRLFHEKISCPC